MRSSLQGMFSGTQPPTGTLYGLGGETFTLMDHADRALNHTLDTIRQTRPRKARQ